MGLAIMSVWKDRFVEAVIATCKYLRRSDESGIMNRRASSLAVILLVAPALAAGEFYFPSAGSDWSRVKPSDAGWNKTRLQKALDYAGSQRSTGVVILHKGKLLAEEYWELPKKNSEKFRRRRLGKDSAGHSIEDVASAQKSVASVLVGMAQEKGLLKISDPVNKHLKPGWSCVARAGRRHHDPPSADDDQRTHATVGL